MRIRTDTKGRDETLRMLMQATDENTKTKAIFLAVEHYINDKRQKERLASQLDRDMAERLSTKQLPIEAPEPRVGPFDE
jgi:uncharacterized protein YigA (DUF484 family)